MKENIRIGLFGIYGLYNYGCEAIVRGTYGIIQEAWPNAEVVLFTYLPEEDMQAIEDLNIIVKHIPMKKGLFFRRIINKLFRTIYIHKQLPLWDAKIVAAECDMVFSIGGDIYTIPQYTIENNKERKFSAIVEFGKTILMHRPLIIWGASIGPFGEKLHIKNYYFDHLGSVNKIFCREDTTYRYLISNNIISNLQICSDPAFYVENSHSYREYPQSDKVRIALNLSPLSVKEQIGEDNLTFKEQIVKAIIDILEISNIELLLVPHVISPLSNKDNDLIYLNDILSSIPKQYSKSIKIVDNAKGFLGTKEFLKSCDLVISARMHCAINAVCEGIPTIFLSYSQKATGMAYYIYSNLNWVIPLKDIERELRNKTLEMLSNKELVSEQIKQRVKEIKNDRTRIIDLLKILG